MRGHSRPKDGVASLAYDPRIHEAAQRLKSYGCNTRRFIMDCRVKPGKDEREVRRSLPATTRVRAMCETLYRGGAGLVSSSARRSDISAMACCARATICSRMICAACG